MKQIGSFIKKVIIFIILFGFVTAGIDYYRMRRGNVPVFNQSLYNTRSHIQSYKGLFYRAERKVLISPREPLEESSDLKFKLILFNLTVPSTWKDKKLEYTLDSSISDTCSDTSLLYYADLKQKIYTYCIDDISINKNGKKEELLSYLKKNSFNDIFNGLSYQGLAKNSIAEVYEHRDTSFSPGIKFYRCHDEVVNDIYLVPSDKELPNDFCTYKDDDFKFIFEIEDKSDEINEESLGETTPEVIYEDDEYRYEFDYPKSNYINITTPAVRGKSETSTPLMTVIQSNMLTIDELIDKGLEVNKVSKNEKTPE